MDTPHLFQRTPVTVLRIFAILAMAFPGMGTAHAQESSFPSALAETNIPVNTAEDELNEDGDCSLREAIQAANTNTATDACPAGDSAAVDVISFVVSGTITLNAQLEVGPGGPLLINGGQTITIGGGEAGSRIFNVTDGADLTLDRLSMTNGRADNGGGILNSGSLTMKDSVLSDNTANTSGAGIYNTGTLTILHSTLSSNYTFNHIGGGIYNLGDLAISDSDLTGNGAYHDGGGIYNTGTLSMTDSIFSNNDANYYGGGLYNSGTISLTSSTLTGNTARYGGGLYNHQNGAATILNSTLSGNIASYEGGAIHADGPVTVASSTLVSNSAGDFGGGLYGYSGPSLRNTILAKNSAGHYGPDCYGTLQSGGYNLIGNPGNPSDCTFASTTGDQVGTSAAPINPGLAPLANNGGPTLTHALYSNSPALNAGNPAVPGSGGNACPATDQRGVARPVGSACDIGAYEGSIPAIIPAPLAPAGTIKDRTPAYKWSKIKGATTYRYQLWKGTTLVYTKIVASSVCNTTTCSNTPTTALGYWVKYKWRAQAKVGGVWKPYSEYKAFLIVPTPKAGFWKGAALEFYVTPNRASVDNFAAYFSVTGCGYYKITHAALVPIKNGNFKFSGSFYASGKFKSVTSASGSLGLSSYYIPGCGYVSGGPYNWTAAWNNPSQPVLAGLEEMSPVVVVPAPEVPSEPIILHPDDR